MKQLNNKFKKAQSLYFQIFNDPFYLFDPTFFEQQKEINSCNPILFQNKGKSPPGRPPSPATVLFCSGTTDKPTFNALAKNKTYVFN